MKPEWIRTKWPDSGAFNRINGLLEKRNVHTVCRSAKCPNIGECFSRNHMTFMILGDVCTRRCKFCSVKKGDTLPPNIDEVNHIVEIVGVLGLIYVIITSVTRDDLPDGGASIFADLIHKLREKDTGVKIEILTPDFFEKSYDVLISAMPYIWAHNIETVPRLYKDIRPRADYKRSLNLLANIKAKKNDILTKSGIMLGLGEEENEVLDVFRGLKSVGVDIITIGQYLKPGMENVDVKKYYTPEEFNWYKEKAFEMGFKFVMSAPLVRSSYRGNDKMNPAPPITNRMGGEDYETKRVMTKSIRLRLKGGAG